MTTTIEDKECFMPKLEFDNWMKWVTDNFTSLYIITQDIWIVFMLFVGVTKYGNIKLGKDDDEPEFTYFQWFAMLFTAGVATGLFFFAATEPQYYYLTSKTFNGAGMAESNTGYSERNRFTYNGVFQDPSSGAEVAVFNTPNVRAQEAMTLTWYHWGIHGWVCYCVVGLLLALLHFRKGLPMTIKTCFYPIFGNRIYGFCGDFIDTLSVVATTMGVCTSLGMGVMQLNYGIEFLNGGKHWMGLEFYNQYNYHEWQDRVGDLKSYWDSWPADKQGNWYDPSTGEVQISTAARVATIEAQNNQQALLIWIITAVATVSVLLGMKRGIATLAMICLCLGQFVLWYIWVMDDTQFLTNFFVQTLGDYMMKLPALGFYSSAVEGTEANNAYGEYSSWQFWWTIFYWGWWIAWAPLVGVFLARLGRGRTVREFITTTMVSAVIYNFIFMIIVGGSGLKMQLLAEKFGVGTSTCSWDSTVHNDNGDLYRQHPFKRNICRTATVAKYSGEAELHCTTVTNLACSLKVDGSAPLFDVVGQYGESGAFMVTLTLFTLSMYFVCSSDSGSLVDDMICANGLPEPSLIQRFVWAMTEGAAAMALLSVGKYVGTVDGGLKALRACSIAIGLPYTFLICLMCVSLWHALQYEMGERIWGQNFKHSIMDFGITLYTCGEGTEKTFNLEKGTVKMDRVKGNALGFVCPPLKLLSIARKVNAKKQGTNQDLVSRQMKVAFACFFFYVGWILIIFSPAVSAKEAPQEWGSIQGNASQPDGNFKYYVSNRFGYFHQWANEDRDVGDRITYNTHVDKRAGEEPMHATIDGVSTEVSVGDHWAPARILSPFGWFMFLWLYCMYVCEVRSDIRQMYCIPGSLFEDWICALIWPTCLTQMDEQLDEDMVSKEVKI